MDTNILREKLLKFLLVSILFFFIGIRSSGEITGLDIWLHLKSGELISGSHTFLQKEVFSFTKEGRPWVNHEWLFQVGVYKAYQIFGEDALVYIKILVFLSAFLLLYFLFLRTNHYLFASCAVLFSFLCGLHRLIIRPDIVSFLFFTAYLFILERKEKNI